MSEQTTFFSRIGGWFKRPADTNGAVEVEKVAAPATPKPENAVPVVTGSIEPRSTFLRPWTRRDATIDQLQTGMLAMSEVMSTIRGSLERQAQRQDEMLQYLVLLPQILEQLPETARVHAEAILELHRQLERQHTQQSQVARVLDRISKADDQQRRALDSLQDRVDWINRNEHALTQSLSNVGLMLQKMTRHTDVSAQVIRQLRDGAAQRDSDMKRVVRKQGRLTNLLLAGVLLGLIAFAAVGLLSYFGLLLPGQ